MFLLQEGFGSFPEGFSNKLIQSAVCPFIPNLSLIEDPVLEGVKVCPSKPWRSRAGTPVFQMIDIN